MNSKQIDYSNVTEPELFAAMRLGSRNPLQERAAGDLGRSRSDPSPPDLEGDGAPVSGRGRSLARVSGCPSVQRAQRVMIKEAGLTA